MRGWSFALGHGERASVALFGAAAIVSIFWARHRSVSIRRSITRNGGSSVEHRRRLHHARSGPRPTLQLEWVHIDEQLAVCVKPTGVAVQGDESAAELRRAVAWDLPPASPSDAFTVARHAHRIDKATGGLLMYARTRSAAARLGTAFAAHDGSVRKTYLALVVGRLEGEGEVSAPIHGKASLSRWSSLGCVRSAASGWISTVRLEPVTGRQHQLRRHLALELGCPILGDPKYLSVEARGDELGGDLHLWAIGVVLQRAGEEPLAVSTAEPEHFERRRRAEESAAEALGDDAWNAAATFAQERRRRARASALAALGRPGPQQTRDV
jgi:23S rRNA-/tRNA-specific pseudouridylate synthase